MTNISNTENDVEEIIQDSYVGKLWICYGSMAGCLLFSLIGLGILSVLIAIGIFIFCFVAVDDATNAPTLSHFRWVKATFLWAILINVISLLVSAVIIGGSFSSGGDAALAGFGGAILIGLIFGLFNLVLFLFRGIKGAVRLSKRQAMA